MTGAFDPPYLQVVIFALCTAFFLVLLWYMLRRPRDRITAYNTTSGAVTISRRALQDIVERSCEPFEEIDRAKVLVRTPRRKLRTEVHLRLRENTRIRDISERLRARITDVLTENLGMEDVGTIEFIVAGIVREKRKPDDTHLEPEVSTGEDKVG